LDDKKDLLGRTVHIFASLDDYREELMQDEVIRYAIEKLEGVIA
jgi:hypothetical protein